jgi:hypothetical protein
MRLTIIATLLTVASAVPVAAQQIPTIAFPPHDTTRPLPPVVRATAGVYTPPPADAVVLFSGADLSKWTAQNGGAAEWIVRDGYFEVAPGKGALRTRESFGDVQLHVEWMSPSPARGTGQNRGNSGVYLMNTYEVQVLDSYESRTYADGQAASIYGQHPPLVNASLAPGVWQSYDIVFRRPRFKADGTLDTPAVLTILHNGVLVQDHAVLTGPTGHYARPPYRAHADSLPVMLQDHSHPVRFRNIWVRRLER